jgi:fatty-acyl-CoA synthase
MNDTDARRRNHWVSHIARHAHERPGGVYLRFEGGSVTWAQIHERVSGLAAELRERGVRAGDRVAIMMTNRPEFLETMFAANAIGAIVVPVNFRLAPDEIAYILTDSGASLLVVEEATAAAAASARAACAHEIGFVSTGHAEGADPYFPAGSGPAGSGPAEPPAVDVPEDSPALIMYTSGTTGRPKGAVLTHQNLMCQSLTLDPGLAAVRRRGGEPVRVAAVPHRLHRRDRADGADRRDHVLLPSGGFSSTATLELMEAERVTSVFLVPAQWQLAVRRRVAGQPRSFGAEDDVVGRRPGHHDPALPDGRCLSRRHQRGRVRPDRDVAGHLRAVRRGRGAEDRFGGQAGEHRGGADRGRRHEGRPARRSRRDRLPRPVGHGRILAEPLGHGRRVSRRLVPLR